MYGQYGIRRHSPFKLVLGRDISDRTVQRHRVVMLNAGDRACAQRIFNGTGEPNLVHGQRRGLISKIVLSSSRSMSGRLPGTYKSGKMIVLTTLDASFPLCPFVPASLRPYLSPRTTKPEPPGFAVLLRRGYGGPEATPGRRTTKKRCRASLRSATPSSTA